MVLAHNFAAVLLDRLNRTLRCAGGYYINWRLEMLCTLANKLSAGTRRVQVEIHDLHSPEF